MGIEFVSPWWLLLTFPAIGLLIWWWHRDNRWGRKKKITLMIFRAAIFSLLILALAGLQLMFPAQGKTVVFVADQSASLSQTNAVWDYIRQSVETKSPDDQFAVIAVGQEAVVDQSLSARPEAHPLSSVVTEHQTDLASGLRLAGGLIPEGASARVVLVSDGEETRGNALEEAGQLQSRGIRVDTVHVAPEEGAEVVVSGMNLPSRLFPGEEYRVNVDVESTVDTEGTLRLYDGNEEVASRHIDVVKGDNTFSFSAEAENTGFHRFRVELDAAHDTVSANNQTYGYSKVMGEPVVLVVEGTENAATNLIAALQSTNIAVERVSASGLPQQLESYKRYSSIVLADVPAFQFGEQKMELIHSAVRDLGVGLVMTGGKESFGMGGWFRTPIEEALPVYMDLRDKERTPSLGLMLVIDKSGSMAGPGGTGKIELAKEAAIRATQMLSPQDQIGVVAFDGSPWWVVEPTYVDDMSSIQEQIGSIQADGGTDIYPALESAYEQLKTLEAKRKHIILLTDGQSGRASPYDALTEQIVNDDITLSTVAVGTDADANLLERLAQEANGRYYLVTDDTTIPTIFSKETALATRTYMVEKPFQPQWTGGADWAEGLEGLPPLGGYIAETAKERAELVMASPEPDPIAARWSYGLGRSVAWTSDLSGNWSLKWIDWPSFREFVNRMLSWTFPQYDQGEWLVETSQEGGKGTVTLTLGDDANLPQGELQVTVVDEELSKETLPLKAVAPGTYSAEFTADEPGAYLLQVSEVSGEEVLHSDTYGMAVSYSPEYRLPQNGDENMQAIAQAGGGESLTQPDQAFADTLERNWERQPVSKWCLLLAMLLLPFDIAARRLTVSQGLLARIRRTFSRRSKAKKQAGYSQTLGRLNDKKMSMEEGRLTSPVIEDNMLKVKTERRSEEPSVTSSQSEHSGDEKFSAPSHSRTLATSDRMSRLLAAKNRTKR